MIESSIRVSRREGQPSHGVLPIPRSIGLPHLGRVIECVDALVIAHRKVVENLAAYAGPSHSLRS